MQLFLRRVVGLLVLAAAVSAAAPTPWDRREEEIKRANAAFATNRLAILKIDDVVYIRAGQRAYLGRRADGALNWQLDPVAAPLLEAAFDGGKIELRDGGKVSTFDADKGGALALDPDIDIRAQLTQVAPGVMGVRLFAYNQQNPAPKAFTGLNYFPYRNAYVIEAAFEAETPQPVDFETSRGWLKQFWRVGAARFTLHGQEVRLGLYAESAKPQGSVSTFFTDATTGKATYGVGRYLDADLTGDFPPKTVTLDFNFAYNPNCARSYYYNCPYPLDHLTVAIEAGEKAPPPR